MLLDTLHLEQYRELKKMCKALYQAWTKSEAFTLRYKGTQATARASVIAGPNAFTVAYAGAEISASVEVTENSLILKTPTGSPAVATIDLTALANNTLTKLVGVISAVPDFTATIAGTVVGTELSKNLAIVAAQDIKAPATYVCAMDRCLLVEAPNATPDTSVGPGGKIFLRDLAYDTLAELVAFLDGLANYECTLGTQMDRTELSTGLANAAAADCKTAPGLDFAMTVNPQMVIKIPAPTASEQITFTGFVGKSTYGNGTSTILIYDGDTLVWSEPAGATGVIKQSLLSRLTMTAGNDMKVKVLNSGEMTAGEMSVSYEIKDAAPYKV